MHRFGSDPFEAFHMLCTSLAETGGGSRENVFVNAPLVCTATFSFLLPHPKKVQRLPFSRVILESRSTGFHCLSKEFDVKTNVKLVMA